MRENREKLIWWDDQDSNLEPIGYEPTALPLSYRPTPNYSTERLSATHVL